MCLVCGLESLWWRPKVYVYEGWGWDMMVVVMKKFAAEVLRLFAAGAL